MVVAASILTDVEAQGGPAEPQSANVDVTVWRLVSDPSLLYVSTRPEGGRWRTESTALDMSALSRSGNFHRSNAVRVRVPLADGGSVNVDVTVWRLVSDPSLLYVSTRPEGGRWRTESTALDMSALSRSGNFHRSNAVRVEVPLGALPEPSQTSAETDREALIALYNATDGPNWTDNDNWLSNRPLIAWHGVTTDRAGRVTGLGLSENELSGEIPAELGNLASLRSLALSRNRLSGEIPSELGNLASLEKLYLSSNKLSGEIPPELGNLASLEWLHLSSNKLSGEIPPELDNLASLEWLRLFRNELNGEIPAELGNLVNLETLELNRNELSGEIPAELGNLVNLRTLVLTSNELSGEIPSEMGNLASLQWLKLASNELSGEIPAELGSLARLRSLELSGNRLGGEIPPELGNLARLEFLFLDRNRLSGGIPSELGNLASLETLLLNHNELSGEIPSELGNLTSLERLNISSNQLSGCVPSELRDARISTGGLEFCAGGSSAPASGTQSGTTSPPTTSLAAGECTLNLVVSAGESCTYPNTSAEFSVDGSGNGTFLFATSATSLTLLETTINGVLYNFEANNQGDGTWIITTVGTPQVVQQ